MLEVERWISSVLREVEEREELARLDDWELGWDMPRMEREGGEEE